MTGPSRETSVRLVMEAMSGPVAEREGHVRAADPDEATSGRHSTWWRRRPARAVTDPAADDRLAADDRGHGGLAAGGDHQRERGGGDVHPAGVAWMRWSGRRRRGVVAADVRGRSQRSGIVSVQYIFDFLAAYFACV